MSSEQVAEALARLSPAAKAISVAQAKTPEEKSRIEALPLDVGSAQVTDVKFAEVRINLKEAPPVRFDLARQVRVSDKARLNMSMATLPSNVKAAHGVVDR